MDIRITEIVINKKMGKKEARFALFISLLFAVMLAFSSFPAGAEFIKANITASIQQEYPASDVVRGWINISLKNEPLESQLSTSFNYSITLSSILQENNLLSKLTCKSSLCNSTFLKIQLEPAGLQLPSDYGNYTLRIMLGSAEIISQNITIVLIPRINSISPSIVPAAVPADFVAYASPVKNSTIVEYEWSFGDGSAAEKAGTNTASHAYSAVGEYALKVSVKDSQGRRASREFAISVVSPASFANSSIKDKKAYMQNASSQIMLLPEWQREFVSSQLNMQGIDSQLSALQESYNSATTAQEYADIMGNLTALDVPKSIIQSSTTVIDIRFSVIPASIDMSKLKNAGAGSYNANNSAEYKDAIASWFALNADASFSLKTILAELDNNDILDVATGIKLKIKPKQQLENVYLVVEKKPSEIKFKNIEVKDINASAAVFAQLPASAEKEIEFIVKGAYGIDDIFSLVYLSPKLSELGLDIQIEPCNFNSACEKELGETWKNCRKDCKPVGLTILYIILIVAGAFVAYIILQEWYKKHYESSLFKNKNDLYNLLSFIDNAKKQGINEGEIARKLREMRWSGEQVGYALRKYKGERTGMWEIPLFRGRERALVKREILKRPGITLPPAPPGPGFAPNR